MIFKIEIVICILPSPVLSLVIEIISELIISTTAHRGIVAWWPSSALVEEGIVVYSKIVLSFFKMLPLAPNCGWEVAVNLKVVDIKYLPFSKEKEKFSGRLVLVVIFKFPFLEISPCLFIVIFIYAPRFASIQ